MIGLARVMLKESSLILIEHISNSFIKKTIREKFPNSTILAIEKFVHKKMDYNKLVKFYFIKIINFLELLFLIMEKLLNLIH